MATVPSIVLPLIYLVLSIIFVPVFFLIVIPLLFFLYKKFFYFTLSPKLIAMIVKIDSADETNFKMCNQLFAGIYGIKRTFWQTIFGLENRVSFEIIAKKNEICFYVICPHAISTIVEKQIFGVYKDIDIEYVDMPKIFD